MTHKSSGIWCDVCGDPILGLLDDDLAHPFKLSVFENEFHACNKCKDVLKTLDEGLGGSGRWEGLPEGPLRREFEKIDKKNKMQVLPPAQESVKLSINDHGQVLITGPTAYKVIEAYRIPDGPWVTRLAKDTE